MAHNPTDAEASASLLETLSKHLPPVASPKKGELVVPPKKPSKSEIQVKIESDTEMDYDYARKKLKELYAQSEETLKHLVEFAKGSEHPKAFEVLAKTFEVSAGMLQQLLEIQKQRAELHGTDTAAGSVGRGAKPTGENPNTPSTTQQNIFVGTAAEMQKLLQEHREQKQPINVTPSS